MGAARDVLRHVERDDPPPPATRGRGGHVPRVLLHHPRGPGPEVESAGHVAAGETRRHVVTAGHRLDGESKNICEYLENICGLPGSS